MTTHLQTAKQTLEQLKPLLITRYHVNMLGLFGSIVRDDFSPKNSDVDIVVDFSQPIGIEFIDMSELLEKELNRKVDVVSRKGLKEKYFNAIEKEILYV